MLFGFQQQRIILALGVPDECYLAFNNKELYWRWAYLMNVIWLSTTKNYIGFGRT
jgi:hypothetical protein